MLLGDSFISLLLLRRTRAYFHIVSPLILYLPTELVLEMFLASFVEKHRNPQHSFWCIYQHPIKENGVSSFLHWQYLFHSSVYIGVDCWTLQHFLMLIFFMRFLLIYYCSTAFKVTQCGLTWRRFWMTDLHLSAFFIVKVELLVRFKGITLDASLPSATCTVCTCSYD